MNKLIRPIIIVVLSAFLVLSCAFVAFSSPKAPAINNLGAAAFFVQTTPTPPIEEDRSEVGSTDEIVILGGVIVIIVLVPILLQRKAWARKDNT
jgi:hypothetical protein